MEGVQVLGRQNPGCPISGVIALAVLHFVSSSELLVTTCTPLECLAFSSLWVIGRVYTILVIDEAGRE